MAIKSKSSQDFVPIKEIRNGVLILKDGSIRSILITSSLNLSLKSYDEQIATISAFQGFLNSLDFPTQICIQSRKLDIRPYLLTLENKIMEQVEPLLKIQTREYIEFIRAFTEEFNIMTKIFYIVVPYTPTSISTGGQFMESLLGGKGTKKQVHDTKKALELASFEEKRSQLEQRIGVIMSGLSRMGIRAKELKTDQVVELFYKTFNPGDISQGIKLQ